MTLLDEIKQLSAEIYPKVVKWRQLIHQSPELSKDEKQTSAFVQQLLNDWNVPFQIYDNNHAVVALIETNNANSHCIALRADMDALPIQEKNDSTYKSQNANVMHACGHDAHTANLLGVVYVVNQLKKKLNGTYKFIFQHSEEKLPSGAEELIQLGVLDNPKVDCIIGQHVSPELTTGTFGFKSGPFMASADEIYLTVEGNGGHAAFPHLVNDTVLCASQLIVSLQQIVSRRLNPLSTTVLSFGKINGEGATNIIPQKVEIAGTFRAFDEKVRQDVHQWITTTAEHVATAHNCRCHVNIVKGSPALINHQEKTTHSFKLAKEYDKDIQIKEIPARMGGEDFAWYSQKIPAVFYRMGTGNELKKTTFGLHTPQFNIDEDAFKHSVGLMTWLAINQF